MKPQVYILAGGLSQRFGSDKARAMIDGVPAILRQTREWTRLGHQVLAVASSVDAYSDLEIQTLADKVAHRGPLGGVVTCLEYHRNLEPSTPALIITCDTIQVDLTFIEPLVQAWKTDLLAAIHATDRLQPFPGLYSADCLPIAESVLNSDKPSMQGFLRRLQHQLITLPGKTQLPTFNTAGELQSWVETERKYPKS